MDIKRKFRVLVNYLDVLVIFIYIFEIGIGNFYQIGSQILNSSKFFVTWCLVYLE